MSNCPPTNVKFKLRRANACDWIASNPILQAGEPGFEADTFRLKIGDGVNHWNTLPYIGGDCMAFDGGFPATQYIGQPVFDCGGILQASTPCCGPTGPVTNCGCSTYTQNTGCTGFSGSTGPSCRSCS
jgi:hypothetical protein